MVIMVPITEAGAVVPRGLDRTEGHPAVAEAGMGVPRAEGTAISTRTAGDSACADRCDSSHGS